MSYKPPASRMRQIKANAPAPIPNPKHAVNVMQAIEQAAIAQAEAVEAEVPVEVAEEIHVPVGIVEVVIKPGDDGLFGTEDDDVSIGARDGKHDGKHTGREHGKDHDHEDHGEPEVDDDEPLVAEAPSVEDTRDVEPVDEPEVEDEPEAKADVEAEPEVEEDVSDDTDADEPAPFDDDSDDEGVAADEVSEKPTYDMGMTKKTLLAVADAHDVEIVGSKSKRSIIAALDAHFA